MTTLRELRAHADERLFAGDYQAALQAYTSLVELQPIDLDARMRVADSLLALGEVQRAAVVYTALAKHAAHAGYPLRALAALKVLQALDPQLGGLLGGIAKLYAVDSQRLGRGVRMSLADLERPLPADWSPAHKEPRQLLEQAAQVGAAIDRVGAIYPDKLPPIPLFSELPADAFAAVLNALKLVRTRPGDVVLREGEPGHAFYVIARGEVRVAKRTDGGEELELARLHDGSIFGEMALVSAQPRSATVTATTDCDLLEFDRSALAAASRDVGTIAKALDKFTRERLLNNLLATAPLFKPLDRRQRLDLVRRFSAHDVTGGVEIIREGQPGQGLFVLLSGEVDVSKRDGSEKVLLASLEPGQVFGEISLLHEQPTTATVTAATNCTVLFLAREYFQRLVQAVPEIREYVENLGEERLMDTRILMAQDVDAEQAAGLGDDELILL